MKYIRVESVQGSRIFGIFEVTGDEYNRIIQERNRRAEREQIERENEQDRQIERQWYQEELFEVE